MIILEIDFTFSINRISQFRLDKIDTTEIKIEMLPIKIRDNT